MSAQLANKNNVMLMIIVLTRHAGKAGTCIDFS